VETGPEFCRKRWRFSAVALRQANGIVTPWQRKPSEEGPGCADNCPTKRVGRCSSTLSGTHFWFLLSQVLDFCCSGGDRGAAHSRVQMIPPTGNSQPHDSKPSGRERTPQVIEKEILIEAGRVSAQYFPYLEEITSTATTGTAEIEAGTFPSGVDITRTLIRRQQCATQVPSLPGRTSTKPRVRRYFVFSSMRSLYFIRVAAAG